MKATTFSKKLNKKFMEKDIITINKDVKDFFELYLQNSCDRKNV